MRQSNGISLKSGVLFLFLGAVFLGMGLGSVGTAGAVAIPGLLGGLAVLVQPLLGLLMIVLIVPFENITTELVGGGATATRFLGILVAGAWLARKLVRRESWSHILHSGLLMAIAIFVMFAMLSTLWAQIPFRLGLELTRFVMAASLTILVIDLLRDWKDAHALVVVMVVGGLVAASLVIQQYLGGARRAGGDIGGGINATAFVLVTLLPFAFYLTRVEGARWKLLGVTYLGLGTLAVTMTFSRMSLLIVPLVLAVESMKSLRSPKGRAAFLVLAVVVVGVGARFVPQDRLAERVETIGPYVQETLRMGGDEGVSTLSSRGYHIRIALAIFREHPILGAGHNSYRLLFLEQYQFEVPGADRMYTSPRSPHGTFWGLLADLGLVGFALWLVILGVAAWALLSAHARLRAAGGLAQQAPGLLVHAIMVALALQVFYMGYQDVETRKTFWVILGLCAAVERLSARATKQKKGTIRLEAPAAGTPSPPVPRAAVRTR